ncbi:bacterio-opsin activator domain-containing protein [Haloarcula litorea]|uniref:helix-turn-helix domain-containing protein n=1 Tax=Haloarcula litorea TaxID=3032579 RepID=UPI0023E77406|nr:bacterio-opsin activator domain-containing protein [Halomicroarcula sp. GDY20]
MSVIVTITVPAADFALGGTLPVDSETTVRLERVVPMSGAFAPYVWITGATPATVEEALTDDEAVASFERLDEVDGERLYRLTWTHSPSGVVDALGDHGGEVVEASAQRGSWTLRLRFADRDDLTGFYRSCRSSGVDVDVTAVHDPESSPDSELGLTATQYETLRAALEAGYFEVPRRTSLTDLAAELGVSDSAVSQRLRRGVGTLLLATVADDD